jgi:uncharacterized protein GlcG (DUF336 family)
VIFLAIMVALTTARPTITAAAAAALVDAAERHAATVGLAIVTVVVDESGVPKAMRRMDGAPLVAVEAARKKALTAIGFGLATGRAWHDFIGEDPILAAGASSLPDFTMLGGGLPLRVDGALVGAIGVSGGHYEQDETCARAALGALGLSVT